MNKTYFKKPLVVAVILLFVGVAVAPSIYADVNILYVEGNKTEITDLTDGIHPPIYIEGNDDFTPENGVTGGNGTEEDPYIIEGWIIEGNGSVEKGVFINNTDAYFVIRNCTVSGFNLWCFLGIELNNVVNGKIENTTSFKNHYAIHIVNSNDIEVINCRWYTISHKGLGCWKSSNIRVSSCECYNIEEAGIYLLDSSDIVIENTFFHDSDYGVRASEKYNSSNPLMNITIKDCKFYNHTWDGIYFRTREQHPIYSRISGCEFYNNGWDYTRGGLFFDRGTHSIVDNCIFHQNRVGITIFTNHNIIQNCSLYDNREGFQILGAIFPPHLAYFARNNKVIHCDIYDNVNGFNLGTVLGVHIEKNNIFNNSWFGLMAFPLCSVKVRYNNIYGNGFAENRQYASGLFCSQSLVDARNNWWGTENGPRCRFHFGDGDRIRHMVSLVLKRPWEREPMPDAGRQ